MTKRERKYHSKSWMYTKLIQKAYKPEIRRGSDSVSMYELTNPKDETDSPLKIQVTKFDYRKTK